jgi:plasmid maintenance system killer protein
MILGYRDKRTENFASGEFTRAFSGFDRQAYKRLEILGAATSLTTSAPSRAIGSKTCEAAGQANSVSASTINGGYVSNGHRTPQARQMSK